MSEISKKIKQEICKIDDLSPQDRKAFLRAIFLICGSVTSTEKSYHIEISVKNQDLAETLLKLLKSFEICDKYVSKSKNYIFYIKNSENISNFLALIGANNAMMDFVNLKIIKEIRKNANRATNCETSNVNKTVNASVAQINKINAIGIENLPDDCREIAKARIDNPESSLAEIALICNKTKSNVSYIINKIMKL